MTPGRRRGGGCWTCHLRRKRCNAVKPICGSCRDLEITCYSNEVKPVWMDGAVRQKRMSETIKATIKQNALLRRERRLLNQEDQSTLNATPTNRAHHTHAASGVVSQDVGRASSSITQSLQHTDSPTSAISARSGGPNIVRSTIHHPANVRFSLASTVSTPETLTLSVGSSSGLSGLLGPVGLVQPISVQHGSIMIYLDYVFPFLFPFYQPLLIETGRQWLLGLLCQNKVSFHVAASLSAYFFSLIPQDDGQELHEDCRALVRNRLLEEMDMAVGSIQCTVATINQNRAQSPLLNKVRIMEEITQLLFVQAIVGGDMDWNIHLTPALMLFDEIFNSHGLSHSGPSMAILLSALPSSIPAVTQHHKPLPNTADQSALVFFASVLLFVDIVASTTLGQQPVLQQYHHTLLSSSTGERCQIRLETVIGCQNWALVAIGRISALHAWKMDAKRNGSFSVLDLVSLAGPISHALDQGLAGLDTDAVSPQTSKTTFERVTAFYARHDRAADFSPIADVTRIWAYAAKIYLSVCLSGWQTKCAEVEISVIKILNLLQTIKSPARLRSLSWPIVVAGCLASPSQENDFRSGIENMDCLSEFGTLGDALRIMEAVWCSRDSIEGDLWNIASSLAIHGSPTLLV